MKKRISVCILATMMNVTSLYSFAAHGRKPKQNRKQGIEQESETQTEEAVDPMSADRLLMRIRVFSPEEVLDAYFWKRKME